VKKYNARVIRLQNNFYSTCYINRYNSSLSTAKDFGIRKSIINGGGMGMIFLVLFLTYALAFWYGGKLIREEGGTYTIGVLLIVC
jgi:ATP-binding cassette, subfamily B (MDR/TAP), member 1